MNNSEIFNDSFEKCLQGHYDTFFERFYRELSAQSPQIATLFEGTSAQRRYDMLEESLLILVDYSVHGVVSPELRLLAELHARLGLDTAMFDHWVNALLVTLQSVDSTFGAAHVRAWREVLTPGVGYMKRACVNGSHY